MDKSNPALDLAIKQAGGATKLASAIGRKPNVVGNWKRRGIPNDACPDIERATGVTCELLAPDLTWLRDDEGAVTGYCIHFDNHSGKTGEVKRAQERRGNSSNG